MGFAPGAYDLSHIGHLNILRHVRARCGHLVVPALVRTDSHAASS